MPPGTAAVAVHPVTPPSPPWTWRIADLVLRTGSWVREGSAPPYPLAQASHDHLLSLAVKESVATGAVVHTDTEPWAA